MEAQSLHKINESSALLVKTPGKPGDLTGILEHIAQTAQQVFATDACVILAFNPITGKFMGNQTIVGHSKANHASNFHESPRPNGVSQQILRDGAIFIENIDAHPQYSNPFTREKNIHSFAGIALRTRHRKRPLGVIYLDFKQPGTFSDIEKESYQIFAVQAAFLLQETWLARHYEHVARIGQDINHNLSTVEALFSGLQKYVDAILDESHTLSLAVLQSQTSTLDVFLSEHGQKCTLHTPVPDAYHVIAESQQSWFISHASEQCKELPFRINEIIGAEGKESLILVPLLLRDIALGILSVQFTEPNTYGQEDLLILQLLASYTALGLHNIRLYSGLDQLNETGQLLTQHLESEQALQFVVDQIRGVTQADVAILCPYESAQHRFVTPPRVSGTLLDSNVDHLMTESPEDIPLLMLQQKKPIFAKECAHLYSKLRSGKPVHKRNFQEREQICSTVALPLLVGDEVVGVMFLNFRTPQRFDATQKLLIEGLAHYAAIVIKNAQKFGTLSSRRMQELEILRKVDRELSRTLELNVVLQTLLDLTHEYVPADEASILLHNSRIQNLETAVAVGRNAETNRKQSISLRETKGITRWVVENKKAIRVHNVRSELPWRDMYVPVADDILSELVVPLIDGDSVIGVLNFESTREGAFHQEEQDFLITMAGQAVLAIKNAQAFEREKRFAAEGQILNDISKEIIGQLDTAHIFSLILKNALEQTHASAGNVMIFDPEQNDLWMAAEEGVAPDKKKLRHTLDEGVVGQVARTKQPLNVDLTLLPWKDIYLDIIPGTRVELAVPMLAGDELRGVLNVESFSANSFTESDERLLKGLADLAVIALQNAQAYEREKRLASESQVLNEISKEITSQLDPLRVFELIVEKATELTHSPLGSLHLYDREANEFYMVTERGVANAKKSFRQNPHEGIVGYAATHRNLINVVDILSPPWNEIYQEFFPGTRSELAVPMFEGAEVRGVLNVESVSPHHFNENDERLLQGLADLAVVALQNAERYEKAESEAERFKLLYQTGQELSKITDLAQVEQAYEVVVNIATTQSQSQVFIYRYDEEAENAEFTLASSSPNHQAPLFLSIGIKDGINGHVARTRTKVLINDTQNLPPDIPPIKLSDPRTRSFFIIPIMYYDQYYGNLGLRHNEVGHFRGTDILFFEWLAQELASTIHRLETVKARQEFEQRAQAEEEMGSIGQSAFEVTHRLGNDLGLIEFYVADIRTELEHTNVINSVVTKKLENILQSVQKVLSLSRNLKQQLARLGEKDQMAGDPVMVSPRELLEEAAIVPTFPLTIAITVEVDEEISQVIVLRPLVADILRNLVTNAIQAMPNGGKLMLSAHNAGRYVALKVRDTGIGISPQKQANIFGLFFSSKDSSGFGLWSARRNALKNHGNLTVESQPGKGTTFTLLLPRANRRLV